MSSPKCRSLVAAAAAALATRVARFRPPALLCAQPPARPFVCLFVCKRAPRANCNRATRARSKSEPKRGVPIIGRAARAYYSPLWAFGPRCAPVLPSTSATTLPLALSLCSGPTRQARVTSPRRHAGVGRCANKKVHFRRDACAAAQPTLLRRLQFCQLCASCNSALTSCLSSSSSSSSSSSLLPSSTRSPIEASRWGRAIKLEAARQLRVAKNLAQRPPQNSAARAAFIGCSQRVRNFVSLARGALNEARQMSAAPGELGARQARARSRGDDNESRPS